MGGPASVYGKVIVMKHVFIVNPSAGTKDHYKAISSALEAYRGKIDYVIYRTGFPKDATEYVRRTCEENPGTTFRFYACGGDGTMNEVLQGVVGQANAGMTVYPCGSGNDFVKCMGGQDLFLNIDALIHAEDEMIDVMKVDENYALNVVNFGFDTIACETMIRIKNKKIIGGKNAYTTGILKAFFAGMKSFCHVTVDGVPLNNDRILLCTVANGQYVGGAYKCAPRSSYRDGMLDVCLADCISHLRLLKLIKYYKNGEHLDHPKFQDFMHYCRGKVIDVTSSSPDFAYCLDGEIIHSNHFTIEILPNTLRFAVPKVKSLPDENVSSDETLCAIP